jgi:hypothetical protein
VVADQVADVPARAEAAELAPRFAQPGEEPGAGAARAEAVDHHLNPHSATGRGDQGVTNRLAAAVLGEDVEAQAKAVAGAVDQGQQRRQPVLAGRVEAQPVAVGDDFERTGIAIVGSGRLAGVCDFAHHRPVSPTGTRSTSADP